MMNDDQIDELNLKEKQLKCALLEEEIKLTRNKNLMIQTIMIALASYKKEDNAKETM